MALTWSDIERMGEDFFCPECGQGFECGDWILEIDGCYYHEGDCVSNAFGVRVPEPPEPPEDDPYDAWRDMQLEKEFEERRRAENKD